MKSFFSLTALWFIFPCMIYAQSVRVGDRLCIEGYVMDRATINRGTLCDNPSLPALANPDRHTVQCLVDAPGAAASGYEVLALVSNRFQPAWRLNTLSTNLVRQLAQDVGVCSSCRGPQHGIVAGFHLLITVEVREVPASGPPVVQLLEAQLTRPNQVLCPSRPVPSPPAPTRAPVRPPTTPSRVDCLTSVQPNVDYFPNKVRPVDSKHWTISYHNTYKIVRNVLSNQSFLLYQCGSTPPADQLDGRHRAVLEIPLRNVAAGNSRAYSFMTELGIPTPAVDRLYTMYSSNLVASSCLRDAINRGQVVVADTAARQQEIVRAAGANSNIVAFMIPNRSTSFPHMVIVNDQDETTVNAQYEWVKFYSAFFNLESRANRLFDAAKRRYQCVASNARTAVAAANNRRPTVLWAFFSRVCNAWQAAYCPDYYCEYAQACSVNLLANLNGPYTTCGFRTMSTAEFVEFGKNADVWIYPNTEWSAVYADFGSSLQTMKPVSTRQVFSYNRNFWHDERITRFYEEVQDFCFVAGTTKGLDRGRRFFNVFGANPNLVGETCPNRDTSALLYETATCENLSPALNGIPPRKVPPPSKAKDDVKFFQGNLGRGNLKRRQRAIRG